MNIKTDHNKETMGMAWVMGWLRWKMIKDKQREQERNYRKKVKKEDKEWE